MRVLVGLDIIIKTRQTGENGDAWDAGLWQTKKTCNMLI